MSTKLLPVDGPQSQLKMWIMARLSCLMPKNAKKVEKSFTSFFFCLKCNVCSTKMYSAFDFVNVFPQNFEAMDLKCSELHLTKTNLISMRMNFVLLYHYNAQCFLPFFRWDFDGMASKLLTLSRVNKFFSWKAAKRISFARFISLFVWFLTLEFSAFFLSSQWRLHFSFLRAEYCLRIDELCLIWTAKHCKQCKVCT